MNYHKCDAQQYKQDYCQMKDDCQDHEKMTEDCYSDMCSDISQMKCKMEKECVKTYKTYYKMYRVCQYRLYKICPCCGHEFDYHQHRGTCPKCGVSM